MGAAVTGVTKDPESKARNWDKQQQDSLGIHGRIPAIDGAMRMK